MREWQVRPRAENGLCVPRSNDSRGIPEKMKHMNKMTLTGALVGLSVLAGATAYAPEHLKLWLSDDVIGMKVVSKTDDSLGKIEDVIVHPGGRASYAVLSYGGVLGMGDKLFAMPWSVLKSADSNTDKKGSDVSLVLPLEQQRLKSAPGFDKKNWPTTANADWTKDIDAYYVGDANPNSRQPIEAGATKSIITWRVTELEGTMVSTSGDESLGKIEEVAIDTNGRVCYVTISVGGFLGMGDKHVAVPWDALKFSVGGDKGDKKMINLDTTKEQLAKAPEFKTGKDQMAAMRDPKWVETVYQYFETKPYWDTSAARDVGTKAKN